MPDRFSNRLTDEIVDFPESIGIPVVVGEVSGPALLPGIRLCQGAIVVDEARLDWPGDLLHEAAHLAMTPSIRRDELEEDAGNDGGEELGAIAWSWAALSHLGLDQETIFHPGGYRGCVPWREPGVEMRPEGNGLTPA